MRDLNLHLLQLDLVWENPEANRRAAEQRMDEAGQADLIVLPEMFSTGFSMQAERLAEPSEGPTLAWMREQAQKRNAALTGSLMVGEDGNFYNRLFWVQPDGAVHTYDKRHLFRLAGEDKVFQAGKRRLIVEWRGWKIMPLICYDLRFPVWSRNTEGVDLLLYVANWPARRSLAWNTLLRARAIENVCWVAGVNRCGTDGNGEPHQGDTALLDPLGNPVVEAGDQSGLFSFTLPAQTVPDVRQRFAFLDDRDAFRLEL
jgi:omega-amidase